MRKATNSRPESHHLVWAHYASEKQETPTNSHVDVLWITCGAILTGPGRLRELSPERACHVAARDEGSNEDGLRLAQNQSRNRQRCFAPRSP